MRADLPEQNFAIPRRAEELRASRLRRWAWTPILLLAVAMVVLWVADLRASFESFYLLISLNFIFSLLTSLFVAYLLSQSFLVRGALGLLMLNGSVIFWGAAGFVGSSAGLLTNANSFDINITITIHNICVWLSALCNLAGAITSLRSKRKILEVGLWLVISYVVVLSIVGLVVLAVWVGWMPTFFIQGEGGTIARQFVISSAIAMFVLAAGLLHAMNRQAPSSFTSWYALALLLFAVGLFGVMIQSATGSASNWTGRAAQYLGGVYLLIAAFASTRESGAAGITLGQALGGVRYRYGIAGAIVIAAAAVRLAFMQVLETRNVFLTFFPAVTLAALYGGLGAGLLATIFSGILVAYFWMEPIGQLAIQKPADWLDLTVFFVSCTLISGISEAMYRAKARANAAETEAKLAAERERAAVAFRESEERLRFALETSHAGVWDLDLVDHTAFRSLEHDRIFGYTELLPQWTYEMFLQHVLPEERAAVDAKFRQATAKQSNWNFECRIRRTDGEIRWIWVSGRHRTDTGGGRHRMAGIVQDITERKQVEEALWKAKEELEMRVRERTAELRSALLYNRSLIETSLDPFVTIGLEGKITDVNAATEAVTGRSRKELIGSDFLDYFTEPDRARAGYQKVFQEGFVRDYPLEIRHQDGHITAVLFNASVYRCEKGKVLGVFAAARDITEIKKAQTALQEANQMLEQRVAERSAELIRSNKDLEQFAYVSSHDLKEPLRMVTGFMSLLKSRYQGILDAKANEYISFAVDAANRMQNLIDALLAYARVGQGNENMPTDLSNVVESALSNLNLRIEESGAVITRDSLPTLPGNPMELTQLFQNLIDNAIKFRGNRKPKIHIGARKEKNHWLFTVSDHGIGIKPEFAEKIFTIFQRLHSREEYPGSGVGLAICKKIVEKYGGRIWVESNPHHGSTFCFTIPSGAKDSK